MSRFITADQNFVRQVNTRIASETMRLYAPLSRAELSARTGLNRSTISSIVGELIERGFVRERELQNDPRVGRPGMLLEFNPEGGCAVGLEIGVDFISIILANFTADVLWKRRVIMEEGIPQLEVVEQAENLINEALEVGREHGIPPLGIGVGVPGLVDTHQGKLILAPNLHWKDIPIRLMWTRQFNLPVFAENEANSGAMGEYFYGAAHGKPNFIYLSTGIGLGGGIMIDGKLFKGSRGYAGEIGHVTLYKGGEQCGCGARGCWETYVGPRYILRRIRQTLEAGQKSILSDLVKGDLDKLNMNFVIEAAAQKDRIALDTLSETGVHLGMGVANLINIFNPELVVMGGALSPASPWLIPIIQESIKENALSLMVESVTIVPSKLGEDSCVQGAVALVLDDILREPLY